VQHDAGLEVGDPGSERVEERLDQRHREAVGVGGDDGDRVAGRAYRDARVAEHAGARRRGVVKGRGNGAGVRPERVVVAGRAQDAGEQEALRVRRGGEDLAVADALAQRRDALRRERREVAFRHRRSLRLQAAHQRRADRAAVERVRPMLGEPFERGRERGLAERVPGPGRRAAAVEEQRAQAGVGGQPRCLLLERRGERTRHPDALLRLRDRDRERVRPGPRGAERPDRVPARDKARHRHRRRAVQRHRRAGGAERVDVDGRRRRARCVDDGERPVRQPDERDQVAAERAVVRIRHGQRRRRCERGVERVPARRERDRPGLRRRPLRRCDGELRAHTSVKPPSTSTVAPVIHPASGEASQRIACATSSGSPRRPSG
jgi:hypothetical protein